MKIQEKYMLRCLELGWKAIGSARPNPAVGACIVHQDRIIGEGYTSPFGGPHAEPNAISKVDDKELLSESTLYVSLEPCSHQGKTPPCTTAIRTHRIPEVVIGIADPNPKVDGRGIRELERAGCKVTVGVAAEQCREHHRRFLTLHERKRPYVILKWAQSIDGFLAPGPALRQPNEPFWLSGVEARQRVHQWRSEEQAILVGANTVLADDPSLTVRKWKGANPLRIVLDKDGIIGPSHRVCNSVAPTILYTENKSLDPGPHPEVKIARFGNEPIRHLLTDLGTRHISSILIEGGAMTLQGFLEEGLWDEARIFVSPLELKSGLAAPRLAGDPVTTECIGRDTLYTYRNDS